MLCPTLYAAITNELNSFVFLKKMRIAAYQVLFLVIRLKGSPHQEVCEYSITTPPPPHPHPPPPLLSI